MSSPDFANALFSKYQEAAASCSALLLTDSSTSPSSSSSARPAASPSCGRVSSGYRHNHVSNGKVAGRLPFPPPSSPSPPSPSSSLPSPTSSWFCLSLSGLNGNSGGAQPGAHHPNQAEICAGGACGSPPGAVPLCASLQRCASERFSGPPQLCSSVARFPEPARRMQQQPQPQQERLEIYPWMRSSGEDGVGGGRVMRGKKIIFESSQVFVCVCQGGGGLNRH